MMSFNHFLCALCVSAVLLLSSRFSSAAQFFPNLFLDPLYMPPAEPLHLAPQFEIPPDLGIIQNSETIDHRRQAPFTIEKS
jgi:hypothetical protein